jgi:hypothetical protein
MGRMVLSWTLGTVVQTGVGAPPVGVPCATVVSQRQVTRLHWRQGLRLHSRVVEMTMPRHWMWANAASGAVRVEHLRWHQALVLGVLVAAVLTAAAAMVALAVLTAASTELPLLQVPLLLLPLPLPLPLLLLEPLSVNLLATGLVQVPGQGQV